MKLIIPLFASITITPSGALRMLPNSAQAVGKPGTTHKKTPDTKGPTNLLNSRFLSLKSVVFYCEFRILISDPTLTKKAVLLWGC